MGTDIWFDVTVEDGPTGWLDQLPDFNLINGDHWSMHVTYDLEKKALVEVDDGTYACYGEGRYSDEEAIIEWAVKFTTEHPDSTVLVGTTWDADGHGEEINVYRKGELDLEDSSIARMVPANLHDLLAAGERAITAYHMPIGDEQRMIEGLVNALEALVKGLKQ